MAKDPERVRESKGLADNATLATIGLMELVLKNLRDTEKLARRITKEISRKGGPSVVALYGNLGSGKTTFAQFLAKALGVKEKILSPTFVIMKTFTITKGNPLYKTMTHVDTYRLNSAKDLIALGLNDLLKDKENILIIEWPEKIEKYLPKSTLRLYFKVMGEKERKVIIKS